MILAEIGLRVPDSVRLAVMDVDVDHPLIWTEQLMPVLPVARVEARRRGDRPRRQSRARLRTLGIHALDALGQPQPHGREINCSIFVKNGPIFSGLAEGGEGYTSFSIASPTGEGMTGPLTFSRQRRCVLVDHFRIV